MKPKIILIALAAANLFSPHTQAAVLYWDGGTTNIATNGDGISQGGSGTWDAGTSNWDAGSGRAHVSWAKRYGAVFSGTAGTVTLGGALTTLGLTFNVDGYIITGTSLLTIKSGGIVANGNTTFNAPLRLGTAQSWTVATGKTLNVSGAVNNNGRLLTITGAGNTLVSGPISGSSGLTKNGTGLLTLSGANTYTGITTLAGGILNLGVAEVAGTSGPLGKPATALGSLLFTGGTLQYSVANASDYSARFSNAGGQSWNIDTNTRDVTYATSLAGTGSSLTKLGLGTLNLTGANTFTGGTTITAGTLNVSGGGLADTGSVNVSGGTYTIAANDTIGALTLSSGTINGASTLTASSYGVQSGSVSAVLAGAGALTKSTSGTVILSGANSYTAGTTINAGILNVTGSLANSGFVRVAGGTYTVTASDTIGALTLSSGTINGGGTLTASSYAVESGTISANLSGAGIALTKSTTGIVTLSGTNSYTGATAINAGTLEVNGTLSASSAVALAAGATLSGTGTVGGAVTVANSATATIIAGNGTSGALTLGSLNFLGAGTIQIGTLSNYTSSAALRITGSLILNGASGAVTLSLPAGAVSAGTYHLINNPLVNLSGFSVTGATLGARQISQLINNAGMINYVVSGANPYWTGALGSEWSTATLAAPKNWALTPSQNADFITNDAVLFDDRATTTTVALAANVNPNVVSFTNATKNYTLQGSGGIASGSLTKSSAGTLTITNANSYSGGTTLYSGIIRVGNDAAFGSGLLTLDSGTLSSHSTAARTLFNSVTIAGNMTLGDVVANGVLNFTGGVDLAAATRQLTTPSNVTMSGVVSNGGLIKSGEGTLTLSGANTYSSGTTVSAGTLAINSASSLGLSSGAVTFSGNSSLRFLSGFSVTRNYSIDSGVTASIDTNANDITQNGIISGAGLLNKTGTGTLTINGANTFSGGTTISGGTLALSGGSALIDAGAVTLANITGAILLLNASETIGSLTGGGASGGLVSLQANTLTVGNALDTTYAGLISGSGAMIKTGSGSLTLSGNNSHTGSTTINSGTLSISTDRALGAVPGSASVGKLVLGGGTLATTASFTLSSNRGITTGGAIDVANGTTLSYGGIAAGTGNLSKTGSGTLVLSGVNTYTGATLVTIGTLAVNGSLAAGSAASIAVDATLTGTGTVSGNVTAEDGAILRAGNGVNGSLNLSGSLTFVGDGLIQIGTLSNYTSTPAINLAGVLTTQDSAASILFSLPTGLVTNGTYHLISHSNNLNPAAFGAYSVTGPTTGSRQAAQLTNNNGVIDYVVSGDTPYWIGAASSAWNTSANNWKLLTAGTTTQFIANDAVLFNDNATGTTTVDIATAVNPAVVSFANSSKNYILQGAAGITTGSLSKTGSGTLTITNANSYNGGTTLSSGVLQIGNISALGTGELTINGGTLSSDSISARSLANSTTLGGDITLGSSVQTGELNLSGSMDLGGATRQITTASYVTISGAISNGGLTKTGSGTLTLTGANTFTGATSVTAGTLVVNGSSMSASTTIAGGATLLGNGSIAGLTTLQSGAIHKPGNDLGLQTITDLAYSGVSVLSWDIDRALVQTRGTGYDALNVSGYLASAGIGAIFRIVITDSDFSNSFWDTSRTWSDIFTSTDGRTVKTNWAAVFSGGFEYYRNNGTAISAPTDQGTFILSGNTLSWNAIPEPDSTTLFCLLTITSLMRRRRSRCGS